MTDHAPIDQPILEILNSYNPLEVKDILISGASLASSSTD